jgi:hypothetical protein
VSATDSGGVELIDVLSVPSLDDLAIAWSLELVRSIEAGGVGPGEAPSWYEAQAITRFDDGTLVLVDRGDPRVVVIAGESDKVLARFGRSGKGPGEIHGSYVALWPGQDGTFWVADSGNGRVSRFSLDGELLGEASWVATGARTAAWRVTPDRGELVAEILENGGASARTVWHHSLARLDPAGGLFNRILQLPSEDLAKSSPARIWSPRSIWAVLPSGLVVVGRSDVATYRIHARDGTLLREIRLPLTRKAIDAAEMQEVMEEIGAVAELSAAASQVDPSVAQYYPIHNDMWPLNDSVFATLQTRRGRAAEDPDLPREERYWRTISTSGRRIGSIRFPQGFIPRWVGDGRIVGVQEDTLGAIRIQEYLLRAPK